MRKPWLSTGSKWDLFGPAASLSHPAWQSWCKLAELYTLVVQPELRLSPHSDLERMDDLQVEHSALFDAVPEYTGLKRPKHHFATHMPVDCWRYGPARGFWCFGFESFNQVIKKGANRSNFRDDAKSVLQYWYWSMRSARAVSRGHW